MMERLQKLQESTGILSWKLLINHLAVRFSALPLPQYAVWRTAAHMCHAPPELYNPWHGPFLPTQERIHFIETTWKLAPTYKILIISNHLVLVTNYPNISHSQPYHFGNKWSEHLHLHKPYTNRKRIAAGSCLPVKLLSQRATCNGQMGSGEGSKVDSI